MESGAIVMDWRYDRERTTWRVGAWWQNSETTVPYLDSSDGKSRTIYMMKLYAEPPQAGTCTNVGLGYSRMRL